MTTQREPHSNHAGRHVIGCAYFLRRMRGVSGVVHTVVLEKGSGYAVFFAKNDLDVLRAIVVCMDVGLKPKIIVNGSSRISSELYRAVIELGGEVVREHAREGLPWEQGVEASGQP